VASAGVAAGGPETGLVGEHHGVDPVAQPERHQDPRHVGLWRCTIALSVRERTREIGALRSIGMSRRQVRHPVRFEAVSLVGVAIGAGLAGVVSAAIPARRAARMAVLDAVRTA
jgi:ABC-type antimicrobial peptide transport system permease subunit